VKATRRGAKARSPSLGRVIARRILGEQGFPKRKIVVSIGLPRPHPRHDWECPFLLEGVGNSKVQCGYGVDAMQALIIALQGIRFTLKKTGRDLFWLDPKTGAGFPILVHTSFGKEFEDRIGLAIERETVRRWRAIIESRREKIRAQEAKLRRQRVAPSKIARSVALGKQDLDEWESWIGKLKPGWNRSTPTSERG